MAGWANWKPGWADEKNFSALCAEFCPPWPETVPAPLFHFIPYKRAKCTVNLTKSFNTFHFVDICQFKASLITLPTEPKSSLPLSVEAITSSNLDAEVKGQWRAFCVQDWPFDGTSWVHSAQNLNSFCIYLHQKFHPHPSTNSWVISSSNERQNERKRPKTQSFSVDDSNVYRLISWLTDWWWNFIKCWPIFKILAPSDSAVNLQ